MIKASLDAEGVEYVMTPKINLFHQKKNAKSKCFDEVYDKFALRIVYKANPHDEKFLA
jgi:GTP pyrophosphokinase